VTDYHAKIIADAKAVLARQRQERLKGLDVILATVAEVCSTTPEAIKKRRAGTGLKNVPRLAFQFLAIECGFKGPEVAEYMEGCSRTNPLHAYRVVLSAMRMAEVVSVLREVLHRHSEFLKGK
jgi:hypothetical protein